VGGCSGVMVVDICHSTKKFPRHVSTKQARCTPTNSRPPKLHFPDMSSVTSVNPQTFFVTGPSTNGILIQLAACGIMTALLTGTPSLTFWRFRYLAYTNFAMLSIVQNFDGVTAFGETANAKLYKAGDLLYFLYVVLQIPGIKVCPRGGGCGVGQQFPASIDPSNPCGPTNQAYYASVEGGRAGWLQQNYGGCGSYSDDCAGDSCGLPGAGLCEQEPYCHWANAIGQLIVKSAQLIIGTQTVDTMYNDYLYMWEELAGKPGKRLTEMIGKRQCTADLISDSQTTRTLYVPLPFYFTQTPGNALPLVAIMFSGCQITVNFEQLRNCIVVSSRDVVVMKCSGGGQVQNNDLKAAIDGTQIFLDVIERDRFASSHFEQLITQVFPLVQSICCAQARVQLAFAHPVIELIWAVRRKCNETANNWFNYSGIDNRDPLFSVELQFNSTARQPMREAPYFRLVQPYQFHSLIPEAFVYCYSFALYPEEAQPSGSANFSRLESVTLILVLQDGLGMETVTAIVFSRSLNMIKFRDGVAGLAFS
jgi:hypothetical protein